MKQRAMKKKAGAKKLLPKNDRERSTAAEDAVRAAPSGGGLREYLVPLLIAAVCLGVYLQVRNHDFIYFDDQEYVLENRHVLTGLSWENVSWAFSFSRENRAYWHPLTWLSHMADMELWGLDPGMQHLTNVSFHIVNVLLLFFVLKLMTGELWKSAFGASLFALHPVNVDTVAWIAERKNLLSTLFWLLTMAGYVFYAKKPGVLRYMLVVGLFVLGLLSKPMLVTLPFVLLLLDYWPLGRIRFGQTGFESRAGIEGRKAASLGEFISSPAVLDKIPLILLSLLSIYAASHSLQVEGVTISFKAVPMYLRMENAIVSYMGYLRELLWPYGLGAYYPFPKVIPLWKVALSLAALMSITAYTVLSMRKRPYLLVGWLWFAGTLVPVSGLMQGGLWPAMADRWAYVPFIGAFIMIAWGVPETVKALPLRRMVLGIAGSAVLIVLAVSTWIQIGYWKDTVSLFTHTLAVTENNDTINFSLGAAYLKEGKMEPAKEYLMKAVEINPDAYRAHTDLGLILCREGDIAGGIGHYREAIRVAPQFTDPYNNLAVQMIKINNLPEAMSLLSRAIAVDPANGEAYCNMGLAMANMGKIEDAVPYFEQAVRFSPYSEKVYYNCGLILGKNGRLDDAIRYFEGALRINSSSARAHSGLGLAYMGKGDLDKAAEHFNQVLTIDPANRTAQAYLQRIGAARRQPPKF